MSKKQLDAFLFITSEIKEEEKRVGRGGGGEYTPYISTDEDREWTSLSAEAQISSTISSYEEKPIKDENDVFVVMGLSKRYNIKKDGSIGDNFRVFTSDLFQVIRRLSAEILAYLNEDHSKILIKCPYDALLKFREHQRYLNKYYNPVKRFGPLLKKEQLSPFLYEDIEWDSIEKPVIIQLMPNITNEKKLHYMSILKKYLEDMNVDIIDVLDSDNIIINMNKKQAGSVLNDIDYVFNISELPTAILDDSITLDRFVVSEKEDAPNEPFNPTAQDQLPSICLLDTGVNDIAPLSDLLIEKNGFFLFPNNDDGCEPHGHGTPIACLASLSENLSNPGAKIISYKVHSDTQRNVYLRAIRRGITQYSDRTRLFLSSIVLEHRNPIATTLIDRLVQSLNILLIMSAGNIRKTELLQNINGGIPYPILNQNYPVSDPAQAHSIFSVGALSKSHSEITIARQNELAPFSRCGKHYPKLFNCPKPEVAQDGGNVCTNGDNYGCLSSFDKSGNQQDIFLGTSFSAPLVARRIAEIEYLYGSKIENAETLKAISIASTSRELHNCVGFGETTYFSNCDSSHAILVTEGSLKLPYTSRPSFRLETSTEIDIEIPDSVKTIEMILVHSDNGSRSSNPSLNTYLTVRARKRGRPSGYVSFLNKNENSKKSHVKWYKWEFKRKSMESTWTFIIKPKVTADMIEDHKKEITIRYGCVFLLSARASARGSLTEDMETLMSSNIR